MSDPGNKDNYMEELGWRDYTDVSKGLPPPLPPPTLPTFDEKSRVEFTFMDEQKRSVLARFLTDGDEFGGPDSFSMSQEEENTLLSIMERNDLTLVIENLFNKFDWNISNLGDCLMAGNVICHDIERLEAQKSSDGAILGYVPTGQRMSMCLRDYINYNKKRLSCLENIQKGDERNKTKELYVFRTKSKISSSCESVCDLDDEFEDVENSLNCIDTALVLTGYDLEHNFTGWFNDVKNNLRYKHIFPGKRLVAMLYFRVISIAFLIYKKDIVFLMSYLCL